MHRNTLKFAAFAIALSILPISCGRNQPSGSDLEEARGTLREARDRVDRLEARLPPEDLANVSNSAQGCVCCCNCPCAGTVARKVAPKRPAAKPAPKPAAPPAARPAPPPIEPPNPPAPPVQVIINNYVSGAPEKQIINAPTTPPVQHRDRGSETDKQTTNRKFFWQLPVRWCRNCAT